ncbi:MAG: hypothetical protein JNK04_11480 [Myxococcales bacterium]|nr:hypothetical protein [Myxococcales bacterium]
MRWEDREPDLQAVAQETKRLFARAGRHKLLVVLLTVLVTLGAAFREYRRQRTYPATVILSATEGENVMDGVSHANDRLIDYVYYVVFTDRILTDMADRHDFRPDLKVKNPRLRIEQFRDFIDINIYKNEFTQPRYIGYPARSAHIAIEFRHVDPEVSLTIARELGDLVISRDAENRRARLEADMATASQVVGMADAEVARFTRRIEVAKESLKTAERGEQGQLWVQIDSDEKGLVEALARQKAAMDAKKTLETRKNADTQSLELRFDRVDWGAPKIAVDKPWAIGKVGLFTFLGLIPVVALGVGAFSRRVYDDRDVTRLGLRSLGFVRRVSRS